MSTSSKSNNLERLRSLMSQHTATTFRKPTTQTSAPAPAPPRPQAMPAPPPAALADSNPAVASPTTKGERYSVRLTPQEVEKIESLALEIHQRVGKRITLAELFRIGLMRLGPNAPITADEVAGVRAMDRRRISANRAGGF